MAEADKLNIDSIIQRLLEGKARYLFTEVAILANSGQDNDSRRCYVSPLSSSLFFFLPLADENTGFNLI